jgi:3-deoxy-D-manno-octulosonic-acid transferase
MDKLLAITSLLFYRLLHYFLTPFLLLRLLFKHQKSRSYTEQRQSLRLAERFGVFKRPKFSSELSQPPIWFHTVSVGEFIASLPLIRKMMQDYPLHPILITCTTTTGSAQIIKIFTTDIQQGHVFHCYLPYDLPGSMKRFLQRTQPCLGLIMETEIWPNMLHVAKQMSIPLWLLNARMSARSAKGYCRVSKLIGDALQQFSGIAAQDILDAQRLSQLGACEHTLHVTGSIKFDIQLDPNDCEKGLVLRKRLCWQDKHVLIAASTHNGEDDLCLRVFRALRQQYPQLVMIIVPRHPERFQSVYQLLNDSNFNVIKRSAINDTLSNASATDVLLGDSMGEMMHYFACADLVFMGGTLVSTGGHNILEPAAMGLPIVYGPYMFNFSAINELFLHHQAARQVSDVDSLEKTLSELLGNKKRADKLAHNAQQLIKNNAGAMANNLALLKPYLG